MKITRNNILYHELIGLDVFIVKHLDPSLEGIKGKVVYETRNTILIRCGDKDKIVLKSGGKFKFYLDDGKEILVNGDDIIGLPEDRVKRII
ncbi:MAG: ribonuclease P protein component 1 [Caldisphaera sp.]